MRDQPHSEPPELADFSFVRRLGRGGFADVFLYAQHRPTREVAVKVLRAEHLGAGGLRQFEVEADVMAEVSEHPYIVTVYTAGVAPDGRPYIVMEHYPQPHFGIRARGGQLSVSEVLRVAVQISSAVETAHDASILHRDIKPANILTSAFGRPGLTDFGISGVRHEGRIEAAGGVTVPFAPPEVLLDDQTPGSEVSDVYSLGATIYGLLSGRPPHWVAGGDNSDSALIGRTTRHAPPPTGRDDTGPLEHLLANAMAIDPAHRPPSALALARALQDVELQLKLPATPIDVRGDVHAPLQIDRDDAEGTRRPIRVVHADGPAALLRPSPLPAPTSPGSAPRSGFPAPIGSGGRETDAATQRRARATGPSALEAPVAPDGTEVPDRRRTLPAPLPVLVAGAVAVVGLVAFVVIGLLGGSDAQDDERARTDGSTTPPPTEPLVPVSIGLPTDLTIEPAPDGSAKVRITWTAPVEADQFELRYRVSPVDPATGLILDQPRLTERFAGVQDVTDTEVTIGGPPMSDDDEPLCVAVQAIGAGNRTSGRSAPSCATTP